MADVASIDSDVVSTSVGADDTAAVDDSASSPTAGASEGGAAADGEADSEDGVDAEPADQDETQLPATKLQRQYYCKVCVYQTSNPREYLYHQKDTHGAKIQINKCPHCVYASKCKIKLNRHMQMVHSGESPPKSSQKLVVRSSAQLLQGGGGGEVEEVTDDVELVEQREDEDSMDVQESPVREGRPVRNVTPKISYDPYTEMKSSTDLKKKFYRCKKCQYLTNVKSRFTKHVKYHSMPMIKCDLCEFRTPYKWNLDRHMKNHNGNGEFQCNQCSFSAHIKQSLTVHIQNHHLPPEEAINKMRAKGNVGGSDVMDDDPAAGFDLDEEELLRLEREEEDEEDEEEEEALNRESSPPVAKPKITARKSLPEESRSNYWTESRERHDFANDFVHPDDIVEKNGSAFLKDYKCSVCSYKTYNERDLQRHEYSQHGVVRNGQIPPVYNAQRRPSFTSASSTSNVSSPPSTLNQKIKPSRPPPSLIPIPPVSGSGADEAGSEPGSSSDGTEVVSGTDPEAAEMAQRAERAAEEFLSATTDAGGTGSVLDRLFNQKMAAANGGGETVKSAPAESTSAPAPTTTASVSRASSTRCQFCRHRCKTTDDLRAHEKTCPSRETQSQPVPAVSQPPRQIDPKDNTEKKVFVWNTATDGEQVKPEPEGLPHNDADDEIKSIHEEGADQDEEMVARSRGPTEEGEAKLVTKRVFKCPECPFWATTASRFHVHLVGHMNMKPYECSECGYRSNWRWDITKHIKLKSAKDQSHLRAKLFINDGGSTRDYDKYDMYLEYMEVEEGLQCKPQVSSSTRRRRGMSSSPVAPTMIRPMPPPQPIPLRPGMTIPPNVTISTSMYGGVPMYEPSLIGSPPLARLPLAMPMPPRLTRAPGTGIPLPSIPGVLRPPMVNIPLRGLMPPPPPPPSLESLKRMDPTLAAMGITDENTAIVMPESPEDARPPPTAGGAPMSAPPQPPGDAKKPTVWRCKKCNFKHKDRRIMLAHVAKHSAKEKFSCGHCGKQSNWLSVIRRHCRMKHDGVIQVIENTSDGGAQPAPLPTSDVTISVVSKDNAAAGGSQFRCDICSFTCASVETAIAAHMQHHTPQPGANFKCTYCPYYVADKQSLSEHMVLHGTATLTPLQNRKAPGDGPQSIVSTAQGEQQQIDFVSFGPAEPQSPHRPFKCTHCPYASEQRVMFLQHRQMHVPRGQPFRCPACTFSTSQRSVLITHARLHGLQPRQTAALATPAPLAGGAPLVPGPPAAAPVEKPRRTLLKPERSTIAGPTLKDSETRHLEEVPLVWVSRGGKFFKMFKCRQCPHVNLRKTNIQDHEKMHTDRDLAGYAHRCTKCNYVCINAGVLSGHLKVHTYWLGKIHAIVDMKRTDEQQLREILGEDYATDVEVVADKSQPPALGGGAGVTPPAAAAAAAAPDAGSTPSAGGGGDPQRVLYFCQHCPARFFHDNEIKIHSRFHGMNLPFTCEQCSYTARQHPHLLAHLKVHSDEYRERTRSLLAIYTTSADHPPRGANAPPSGGTPNSLNGAAIKKPLPATPVQSLPKPPTGISPLAVSPMTAASLNGASKIKRYRCGLCPARFMKEATLRYHQSLHGSNGPFRCTRCNYAVKTYGNLVQHLNLHSESDQKAAGGASSELSRPRAIDDFPMSGVDLLKRKLDFEKEYSGGEMPSKKVMRFAPASMMDPNSPYYAERTGNPDFAYPTVLDKYGREREKRYKCQKCPSAFEKREQYIKHISLHNSQNRYTCTVCDYSVKYYPNFCNHMKRHGIRPPPMLEAANATYSAAESRSASPAVDADGVRLPARANYTGAPELTAVERQQLVLQRVKEEQDAVKDEEPARKVHWCELCPYANTRRGTTEDHRWRHRFYGSRGGFGCRFCDYACQQSHLLREHHKIHFRASKYVKVDSYTQLVGLEVFMKEVPDGEDKENMSVDFSHVDIADHDLLFRASETGDADSRPEPAGADPSLLVDVANGELVCEKPEHPPPAVNGLKDKDNEVKEEENEEEDGQESGKDEEMNSSGEDDDDAEDGGVEEDDDKEEKEDEGQSMDVETVNEKEQPAEDNTEKTTGEEAADGDGAEDVMTQEEAAVNAITQQEPPPPVAAPSVEPTPEPVEFPVPEDDGEAAAAVLALQAAEMSELEPPDLTIGQSEQPPPPLDDEDDEPPNLTGDDQHRPPPPPAPAADHADAPPAQ